MKGESCYVIWMMMGFYGEVMCGKGANGNIKEYGQILVCSVLI